jgi:hypothetical protein
MEVSESLATLNGPSSTTWIGLFDILGFRELHKRMSGVDLAHVIQRVPRMAHLIGSQQELGGRLGYFAYADTILLYPREVRDPALSLMQMLHYGAFLMATSMSAQLPLRGAITKGDFLMSPTYRDAEGNFTGQQVWGKALMRAYELERCQDWAGAIVDLDAIDTDADRDGVALARRAGAVVDYPVPLKVDAPTGNFAALNWPKYWLGSSDSHLRRLAHLGPDGDKAAGKRQATLDFYRWSKQRYPELPLPSNA